jgi:ubiquinol-cytochrome c reductase cytochrome b subunit
VSLPTIILTRVPCNQKGWRHSLVKPWGLFKFKYLIQYIVIWGGFSVNNATLNRFFSLHYVLPFVLAALALIHLIVLHDSVGSGNPLGISGNYDRLPFAPYFLFKDLITIFIFILILSLFVFYMPNLLGDSENYVMANPMQTPPAIVPEW